MRYPVSGDHVDLPQKGGQRCTTHLDDRRQSLAGHWITVAELQLYLRHNIILLVTIPLYGPLYLWSQMTNECDEYRWISAGLQVSQIFDQ